MGVKGLATFIKENRQSLCRSVHFSANQNEGHERVPVVVDAWGIIYTLWLAALPWQSGGEYLRFYRLACRLVEAWREVGLEPTFVFDGSAPNEKLDTQLRRLDDTLRTAQLFYTTSPASRSGPSFSRGSVILPPFASHTFIHALADLDVATHFVPLGEADGECVIIAEQLGAYILGQDSDFPILISASGLRRVRGYCPLEMMMWIEDDPGVRRTEALHTSTGWTSVAPAKKVQGERSSPLLPPAGMRRPKLVMTSISPGALRTRLRLPAAMLPLFASLVGNDYTPPAAPEHFFSPGLNNLGRIEKVARVIREVVFSTQQLQSTSASADAGDNAVELVRTIILKLAWKPFVSEGVLRGLVEAIIKATFQYILPVGGVCCGIYPFCGELDKGCQTRPVSRSATPMSNGTDSIKGEEDHVLQAKKMYAMGQRKGIMQSMTHAWLFPDRVMLWSVLEDPSGPSLKATKGARGLREAAYLICEEGMGGLRWPEEEEEEEEGEEQKEGDEVDGEKGITAMMESLETSTVSSSQGTPSSSQTTVVEEPTKTLDVPKRSITEYVRHTNRYAAFRLDLPPPLSQSIPTCLLPLPDRLKAYLEPLSSSHASMLALPPQIQPLAAITRFAVLEASKRGETVWKRSEVEAVLKSFIWTLSTWIWEKRSRVLSRPDPELTYPLLTNRHSQIVAQIGVVMIDSIMLAQSLLLAPHTPIEPPASEPPKSPVGGRRMPTLTHLTPWMFFSGVSLHTLLSHATPPGWEWSEKDEATYQACFAAVMEGLDGDVVKGWSGSGPATRGMASLEVSTEEDVPKFPAGGRRNREKKAGGGGKAAPAKVIGMGRFDILGATQA